MGWDLTGYEGSGTNTGSSRDDINPSGLLALSLSAFVSSLFQSAHPSLLVRAHADDATYSMMPGPSRFGLVYHDRSRAKLRDSYTNILANHQFSTGNSRTIMRYTGQSECPTLT